MVSPSEDRRRGQDQRPGEALPDIVRAVYPWAGHRLAVDGGDLHYIDEGPRDAPVLLCVHGNPTWSFYWRAIVKRFSATHRVVVPDHIGCGLSDKPGDWPYRLDGHVRNLIALIEHLDLTDMTLIVHDWGGAIGMGAATRQPERFRRFVVTNTAAFLSQDIPPSIASVRIPGFGALAVLGMNGFARAATFRSVEKRLAPAAKAGLLFPYSSWKKRIATLRFVQDIPLKASHPSHATLEAIDHGLAKLRGKPMMLVWGDADFCFHKGFREEWQRRFPDATVHAWADVGHYVMEDAPDRVLPLVSAFIEGHPTG